MTKQKRWQELRSDFIKESERVQLTECHVNMTEDYLKKNCRLIAYEIPDFYDIFFSSCIKTQIQTTYCRFKSTTLNQTKLKQTKLTVGISTTTSSPSCDSVIYITEIETIEY